MNDRLLFTKYAKCDDKRPDLQIALYEYGNDNLNGMEGYIRQVIAFSDDLDDISKHLFSPLLPPPNYASDK